MRPCDILINKKQDMLLKKTYYYYYAQLEEGLKRYGEEDKGPAFAKDNASYRAAVYAHLHLDPEEVLD
jgi:hypothetical protein